MTANPRPSLRPQVGFALLHVILYQPEIPPNTGNIMRLCANTGARLHLIKPLGFILDDRRLRRAGLDYRDWAHVTLHEELTACLAQLQPPRLWALTTKGQRSAFSVAFQANDAVLFGPETRGLPNELLHQLAPDQRLRLPMLSGSRSLNLANAVAIVVYEAWRQQGFLAGE